MNTDWETSKKPKAPKKIRAKGIRGLLGVISPSKSTYYAATGDKEVKAYLGSVRKELQARNHERRMARILQVFENAKTD